MQRPTGNTTGRASGVQRQLATMPGCWPELERDAFWHGYLAGQRMAQWAAANGCGVRSLAGGKIMKALRTGGDLRPITLAQGRELARKVGLSRVREAFWRERYAGVYAEAVCNEFAASSLGPDTCALQARTEGWLAASHFGLTGHDWLN